MLIGWIVFVLTIIFTFIILYYLYKRLLKISSKVISSIIFILIIPIYSIAMPLIILMFFGFVNNFFDFKMNPSYWEIRGPLTVAGIMWINAFFGLSLFIKLILTHNKNEETNNLP